MFHNSEFSTKIDPPMAPRQAQPVSRRTKDLGPAIGRRLRAARNDAGMSQRALAKLAHTSPVTIVTLERGEGGNSGIGLFLDVARALKVSPEWLIFGRSFDEK